MGVVPQCAGKPTAAAPARPARNGEVVCRWLDADLQLGAALSSDGATLYRIDRTGNTFSCDCQGNHTWGRVCRHIKALQEKMPRCHPAFQCIECGQYPACQDSVLCRHCADAADARLSRLPVDLADSHECGTCDTRIDAGRVFCDRCARYQQDEMGSGDMPYDPEQPVRSDTHSVRADLLPAAPPAWVAEQRAEVERERASRERHAAALAAPVGTFTELAGPAFGLIG